MARKNNLDEEAEQEQHVSETTADVAMASDVNELKKIEEILTASDVSGGILRLERKAPTETKWQHVCKMKVEDFDIEQVKANYGGGDYRAQTFRSNGGYWKKFEFSIDYRSKGLMDAAPMSSNGDGTKAYLSHADESSKRMAEMQEKAAAGQNSMMMMLMTVMQESNRAQIAAMQEASKQQMASMQGMFTAIAGIAKPVPTADAATLWMPLMLKMIESKGNGGTGSMTDTLETIRQLQDITANLPQKEEKEEDMFDKMAKILGPVAAAFVSRASGAPSPIQAQVSDQPVPTPQLNPNDPRSYAIGILNSLRGRLKVATPFILNAARKNADPQSYYDMVADNVSDDEYRLLMEALKEENWIDILFEGNLDVHKNRAWFESLRKLFIEPEAEPEPVTVAPTDNGQPTTDDQTT